MVALKAKKKKEREMQHGRYNTTCYITPNRHQKKRSCHFCPKLMKLIYTNPLFYCLQTFKPQRQAIYFSSHKGKHKV